MNHPDTFTSRGGVLLACLAIVAASLVYSCARAGTATVTLGQEAKNTDGTALTDLAGHRILYGTDPGSLSQTINLPAGVSVYVIDNLTAGTWYVAARTFTTSGAESALSNIDSKTIAADPVPEPTPTILLTVGGPVYTAMPNYTTFSWKLGSQVGTIVVNVKCDPTRRIGEYYRVTSPIIWTSYKKDYVVARCTWS